MADNLVEFLVVDNFIGIFNDNERILQHRQMAINRRQLRDAYDPFSISDRCFERIYRVPKVAAHALIDDLTPHLQRPIRITAIPIWMRVMTTLNFLAAGSYQRRVGQDFLQAMCQSRVSTTMKEVVQAMNQHLMGTWVQFPLNEAARQNIKERFWQARQFPGVIGCVDGTQIAIFPPKRERAHLYMNRKGYFSKNVQIVCDFDLRILAVNARHGGRAHDSHIWRMSAPRRELEALYAAGHRGTWLLGDSGYPSEPWLLRPFANDPGANLPEGRYNNRHTSCRNTVERCIGVLKAKFRCCRKERALHYSPEVAGLIINACVILHNIGIHYRLPNPEPIFDDIDAVVNAPAQLHVADVHAAGHAARARVVRDFFTN